MCDSSRERKQLDANGFDIHDSSLLLNSNGEQYDGVYTTDLLLDKSLSVIEEFSNKAKDNNEERLFLHISMAATHGGLSDEPQFKESELNSNELLLNISKKSQERGAFATMANNLDASLERIVSKLEVEGIYNDSLIIVISDNGGSSEDGSGSSNYPLRGGKFSYFNGGIMTNFVAIIPGEKRRGGEKEGSNQFNSLFTIADIFPTILDAVGGDISTLPKDLDGKSKYQAMNDVISYSKVKEAAEIIVTGVDTVVRCGAVYFGEYKLVVNGTCGGLGFGGWKPPNDADGSISRKPPVNEIGKDVLLFDLGFDPYEEHDLSSAGPKFEKIKNEMMKAFEERITEAPVDRQTTNRGCDLKLVDPSVNPKLGGSYGPWILE